MSHPTPAEGWSELLLLPEFLLIDASTDENDELVADVQLPREVRREFGVGWNTVMGAVLAAGEQLTPARASRSGSTRP